MNDVLVVDDEASMRAALDASFRRGGWRVSTASGVADALTKVRSSPCALVVTDMRMGDGDGLAVMQGVRGMAPETAVILLTAYGSVPEAVLAMKEGACDYLMKPVSFEQLEAAAQRILGQSTEGQDPHAAELIGESLAVQSLVAKARRVALTDADVLIEAESGTGKELLARLIHRSSPRAAKPFVAVNCSAFPENLLESELFGHVRGAFTGAFAAKPGKFQVADGGTLLLDEIGEMPHSLQPKLLRVLQEREIDRLGDTHPVPVNVRVIATTNRSLPQLIEEGSFRADLYYRLNVIPLSLPPLRERREDILGLAEHFLRKYEPKSQRGHFQISESLAFAATCTRLAGQRARAGKFHAPCAGPHAGQHARPRPVRLRWPGPRRPPVLALAQVRGHPGGYGALAARGHLAGHPREPHADGGDDGREPAHRAQQDPRVRPGRPGGAVSWLNSVQVNLLERFLDLAAKRQGLITSNIANVDTPGYRTKDIDFQGELERALQGDTGTTEPFVREVPGLVTRPDGNNVSVDRESLLLSEVQLQFGIAEQLLKAQFRNVKLAINEGNSSI